MQAQKSKTFLTERSDTKEYKHKELLLIYRNCIKSRLLEYRLSELWHEHRGRVIFSGLGAEVAPSVIATQLMPEDNLIPRYRGIAAIVSKGVAAEKIVAEALRRKTGTARGIGDVSSWGDPTHGVPGYTISLGAMFSVAIGLALSACLRNERRIIVQFFGDGEATRATFAGALNLASLWGLPILFVCENNGVCDSVATRDISAARNFADVATAYQVKNQVVSDMDASDLYTRTKAILNFVRTERRPFFLEIMCRRFPPHSSAYERSAPGKKSVPKEFDPLVKFKDYLIDAGVTEDEITKMVRDEKEAIEKIITKTQSDSILTEEEFFSVFYE